MVTVITKTIGPTGRDYATFTFAEADVLNVGTSGDLVANDEAIVFEADAGDYLETLDFNTSGGLTCDATRNVTWTHATGAGHGGQFESGANLVGGCAMREDHAVVDGLSVSPSSGGAAGIFGAPEGVVLRNMMVYSTNNYAIRLDRGATAAFPGVVENCVCKSDSLRPFDIRSEGSGVDAHWRVINTTVFTAGTNVAFQVGSSSSDTLHLELTNVLVLGARAFFDFGGATLVLTGSNNFGPATLPFPAALQGSPYPITASTAYDPGAGDFALYVGKNGALLDSPHNDVIDGGVGPASNSDVPTTDILGDTRSGTTTNPGAFALAQATAVITKTIGPVGRDYATFTAAEADVENIGTSADLVFENEAIVFEADAGTYSGATVFSSSLTTDATRQVTYKPAAGSEHGGVPGAGVYLEEASSKVVRNDDAYTAFIGLSIDRAQTRVAAAVGVVFSECLFGDFELLGGSVTVTNSTASPLGFGLGQFVCRAFNADATMEAINCTALAGSVDGFIQRADTGLTSDLALVNCLSLTTNSYRIGGGSGTNNTPTGSNNFGGASNPFPAAIQGSPYPITATTNTTPGFGDYAIYNASTGALVVVDDNAALGGGVGPAANADVPVYDINGVKRIGGGCDPGAFEGVRSRSLDVWDVVTATHTTPGTFGELLQQVYLLTRTAAAGRIV